MQIGRNLNEPTHLLSFNKYWRREKEEKNCFFFLLNAVSVKSSSVFCAGNDEVLGRAGKVNLAIIAGNLCDSFLNFLFFMKFFNYHEKNVSL